MYCKFISSKKIRGKSNNKIVPTKFLRRTEKLKKVFKNMLFICSIQINQLWKKKTRSTLNLTLIYIKRFNNQLKRIYGKYNRFKMLFFNLSKKNTYNQKQIHIKHNY